MCRGAVSPFNASFTVDTHNVILATRSDCSERVLMAFMLSRLDAWVE